ncbi:MAG: DegT/DnrJ/EryC1/StrS family aminotransferase [bacterium]|nr:DegT/DnrJ/EryC1/StrS family aminotransferase [bacterium]
MEIPLVDLKVQYRSIKSEIDAAISSVLQDAVFIKGRYVDEFERHFADYLGIRHCIGVGNGTDAIFIALKMLGVGSGDEVITAANTFIATSEAISLAGAKPVFVDCNPETYNIDTERVEAAITPRTKAVIPVHLYGQSADMDPILALAEKHNLTIVEDAAQAHGATYGGRKAGTFGACATFSFYPGKNLGAYGDGGAIVTNDDALAQKMRMFANHGRKDKYLHEFEGVNSRLDALQAAILDVKLKHLEHWIERRRAVARRYDEALRGIVETPKAMADARHAYHLYVIRVNDREKVQKKLLEDGIGTGVHYPVPLPLLPAYRHLGHQAKDFPVASRLAGEILSIPINESMEQPQVDYVVEKLKNVLTH